MLRGGGGYQDSTTDPSHVECRYNKVQTLAYANVHLMCADPVTGKFDKAGVAAAASAGAAAVATFLFLPLDVVRARLTVQGNGHTRIGPRPYSSIWNCISSIRQREGVRALYRGLTPAVLCKGFAAGAAGAAIAADAAVAAVVAGAAALCVWQWYCVCG